VAKEHRGRCALCGQDRTLAVSHIVPRFAGRWLIESSATGYLRDAVTPNRRKQDIEKRRLLCTECEAALSKDERSFADRFFRPYAAGQLSFPVTYGPWALRFVVSLSWRLLAADLEQFVGRYPQWATITKDAERQWRLFLLGKAESGEWTHHVFFCHPDCFRSDEPLPEKLPWYIFRGVDGTVVYSPDKLFLFSNLCGIMAFSCLVPSCPEGLQGTQLRLRGTIPGVQVIDWPALGVFLANRVKQVFDRPLSARQNRLIETSVRQRFDRVAASDDARIWRLTLGQSER
jgi:hypothetical protein